MESYSASSMQRNIEVLAVQLGHDPNEELVCSIAKKLLASTGEDLTSARSSKETFRLLLKNVDEDVQITFLKLYRKLMLNSANTTTAVVAFLVELLGLNAAAETKSIVVKCNSGRKSKEVVVPRKELHDRKPKNSKLPAVSVPLGPVATSKGAVKARKESLRTNFEKQQQALSDLLHCLQGLDGKSLFFKLPPGLDWKQGFFINRSCDAGLRGFIEPFFPTCMDVRRLSDFIDRQRNTGIIHSEICVTIRKFLREHLVHGAEWKKLLACKKLTYQSLWLYVQSTRKVFRCLARLCDLIDKEQTRGGATLEVIEKAVGRYDGDSVVSPIVEHLRQKIGNAYFEFLNEWLRTGQVIDAHGEFMIDLGQAASVTLRTGSMEEVSSFIPSTKVNRKMCPSFLHPLADKIREAGIFVQILLSSGYWEHNQRYSRIEYSPEGGMCVAKIEDMCKEISQAFVQYLKDDLGLVSHIASIRYMYFLCRGDWLIDFIDAAEDYLCLPLEDVHLDRLENLFSCALRNSSLRSFAFLQDVKLRLRSTRIQNIIRYVSRNIVPGTSKRFDRTDKNMLLYEAFSITYEPKWPLSMLFTPFLTTHFEILFRWLMLFKYVDRQLSKTWMLNSDVTFALFKRMFGVVFDILNLMTTSVIDPLWKELLINVKSEELTFEELKVHLDDAITSCLNKCFACDESLTETIVHLLSSCLRFQNTIRQSKAVDHVLIEKLDREFKDALAELTSRLPQGDEPAYYIPFAESERTAGLD